MIMAELKAAGKDMASEMLGNDSMVQLSADIKMDPDADTALGLLIGQFPKDYKLETDEMVEAKKKANKPPSQDQ